jgi:hypothetical protein
MTKRVEVMMDGEFGDNRDLSHLEADKYLPKFLYDLRKLRDTTENK